MSKFTREKKRIALEIVILIMVLGALVLSMTVMQQPKEREFEWVNPNKLSSSQLVEDPKAFDQQEIEFMGEAVTARMVRKNSDGDDGAWIHLNDDPYMYSSASAGGQLSGYNSGVAVWVQDASLTDGVQNYGGYKTNGDIVKVRGIFHAACSEHDGDTDLHAASVEVVSAGRANVRVIPKWKIAVAGIFVLLGFIMLAIDRRRLLREKLGQWTPLSNRD